MGDKEFDYYFAQSFAYGDYEQSTAKKYTRLYQLLVEFEAVAPRKEQVDVIKPHLPQAKRHKWAASLSTRDNNGDPSAAAVVGPERCSMS